MRPIALVVVAAALIAWPAPARADAEIAPHGVVAGYEIGEAEARGGSLGGAWRAFAWEELSKLTLAAGRYQVRLRVNASASVEAVQLPVCAGVPGKIAVDGKPADAARPVVARLGDGSHAVVFDVNVSSYEHRIACGSRPRAGVAQTARDDLGVMTFESPHAPKGGGRAVVYVPPGHDFAAPSALLVGTHPWNGDAWTYAAYEELLGEAKKRDVLVLLPSGLGNSLYIADAEDEVMLALDRFEKLVAVDPRAVSIWGASMGGAGATTIGFHHPDKFASITSYFGDSKYDVTTYVRSILPDDPTAHQVNALDIVDNARNVPVWLIHGEADHVSPIAQSEMLDQAMHARGFDVRFDRVPKRGHEGEVVARFLAEVVAKARAARVPEAPKRVTYWSVRPTDTGAYGVRIERASSKGDAFVDLENKDGVVHVRRASGVRAIELDRGALGAADGAAIVVDDGARVTARWK
jgi:pimeloyl-ACP methyl ester carboxylesterase